MNFVSINTLFIHSNLVQTSLNFTFFRLEFFLTLLQSFFLYATAVKKIEGYE